MLCKGNFYVQGNDLSRTSFGVGFWPALTFFIFLKWPKYCILGGCGGAANGHGISNAGTRVGSLIQKYILNN